MRCFLVVCFTSCLWLTFPEYAFARESQQGINRTHRVEPGETLLQIANRYSVSLAQLIAFNGLRNPNLIYIGQQIKIPGRVPQAFIPLIQGGSTQSFSPIRCDHRVRRGETLYQLSLRYGTSISALMRINKLSSAHFIRVNQCLITR